jgi:tRNA G10  N-methylase Trm11
MHMIRHQLHHQYLKIVLLGNLVEKFFNTFLDRTKQKGFAIFRYPNQVIFQIVDYMMSSFWRDRRISYRKSLCPPPVDSLYILDLPVGVLQA